MRWVAPLVRVDLQLGVVESFLLIISPGSLEYKTNQYARKPSTPLNDIVSSLMKRDVQSGDVFIFVNRRLTTMKILHLVHGSLVIYHKKLESGVFKLPAFDERLISHE